MLVWSLCAHPLCNKFDTKGFSQGSTPLEVFLDDLGILAICTLDLLVEMLVPVVDVVHTYSTAHVNP